MPPRNRRGSAPSSRVAPAARKNRRHIKRKRGAKAQQSQLLAMNRNIMRLNRAVGLTKQHAQYSQNLSTQIGYNTLNGPAGTYAPATNLKGWNIQEIITPGNPAVAAASGPRWPGWSPIFQATNEVENANKFFLERCHLKMHFNMNYPAYSTQITDYTRRPTYPRDVTIFIVSFKPDAWPQARSDFFDTDSYLDPTVFNALNSGQYWTSAPKRFAGEDALPMLNPAVFNIHYRKVITLGQTTGYSATVPEPTLPDVPAYSLEGARAVSFSTNIKDVQRNISHTLPMGKMLKSTTGDKKWKQLEANEIEYHERRWLLFHVSGYQQAGGDGPGTQGLIGVTCNFMFTGKGTN